MMADETSGIEKLRAFANAAETWNTRWERT